MATKINYYRSRAIILNDLFSACEALERNRQPELPSATPFRLYPQWLAGHGGREVEAFCSELPSDV